MNAGLPRVPPSKNIKTHWLLGVAGTVLFVIGTAWVGATESRFQRASDENIARKLEITELKVRLDTMAWKIGELSESNKKLAEVNQTLANRVEQLLESFRTRRATTDPRTTPYPLQGG